MRDRGSMEITGDAAGLLSWIDYARLTNRQGVFLESDLEGGLGVDPSISREIFPPLFKENFTENNKVGEVSSVVRGEMALGKRRVKVVRSTPSSLKNSRKRPSLILEKERVWGGTGLQ